MSVTSSAVIQSKILVAGVNGPTELFDTTSAGGRNFPSMCEPRDAPVSAVIRGRFHVCGGWNRADVRATNSAECFRSAQERMAVVASHVCAPLGMLQPLWLAITCTCVAAMVIIGRPHKSVERFDILSEIWEAQPAMVHERMDACAAVIEDSSTWSEAELAVIRGRSSVERFVGAWTTLAPMTPLQMSLHDRRRRREALRIWW